MAGLNPEDVIELKHGLAGMAEVTYAFYDALVKQGFAVDQAMRLTATFLSTTIMQSHGGDSSDT